LDALYHWVTHYSLLGKILHIILARFSGYVWVQRYHHRRDRGRAKKSNCTFFRVRCMNLLAVFIFRSNHHFRQPNSVQHKEQHNNGPANTTKTWKHPHACKPDLPKRIDAPYQNEELDGYPEIKTINPCTGFQVHGLLHSPVSKKNKQTCN